MLTFILEVLINLSIYFLYMTLSTQQWAGHVLQGLALCVDTERIEAWSLPRHSQPLLVIGVTCDLEDHCVIFNVVSCRKHHLSLGVPAGAAAG